MLECGEQFQITQGNSATVHCISCSGKTLFKIVT